MSLSCVQYRISYRSYHIKIRIVLWSLYRDTPTCQCLNGTFNNGTCNKQMSLQNDLMRQMSMWYSSERFCVPVDSNQLGCLNSFHSLQIFLKYNTSWHDNKQEKYLKLPKNCNCSSYQHDINVKSILMSKVVSWPPISCSYME